LVEIRATGFNALSLDVILEVKKWRIVFLRSMMWIFVKEAKKIANNTLYYYFSEKMFIL
jgi:hypothetical protein